MKSLFVITACVLLSHTFMSHAQILKDINKRVENKVKQRANRKVDKTVDKGLDKVEEAGKNVPGKDDKKEGTIAKEEPMRSNDRNVGMGNASGNTFKVNSKFDFVAGDKVVAIDDFARANVGDFPSEWHTNGSGEIVTVEGQQGKWLEMRGDFTYYPEFIKDLPDNFTLEFDLIFNNDITFLVKNIFGLYIVAADEKSRNEPAYRYGFNEPGKGGAAIEFESYKPDRLNIFRWSNKKIDQDSKSFSEVGFIKSLRNQKVRVSVWRQKERVRMYLNDDKIVDAPRLLAAGEHYNMIKFAFEDNKNNGRAYVSNVRFAESSPDMRSKLINEGKFVTSGIYFNTASDEIKRESYGILREIAEALKTSEHIRIKIVGHTDSDGSDESNLALSRKRAQSVQDALIRDFGIESSRIETDGRGESDPIAPNSSEEGKANNRRVEFIKL